MYSCEDCGQPAKRGHFLCERCDALMNLPAAGVPRLRWLRWLVDHGRMGDEVPLRRREEAMRRA